MPTIADQVATMEHDHAAALVLIDQLNAKNAALTSANTGLRNENVALGVELNNMKHFVDDTRAMVETLASSAYDMLRTTRRQVDTPAEVIPFAPNRAATVERIANLAGTTADGSILPPESLGGIDRTKSPFWKNAATFYKPSDDSLDARAATLPDKWPAGATSLKPDDKIVYQADSGDENDADQHMTAAEIATLEEQDASNANALSSQEPEERATPLPPHAGPMLVRHEGDLPIFLRRDAPFGASDRAIFG